MCDDPGGYREGVGRTREPWEQPDGGGSVGVRVECVCVWGGGGREGGG